MKVVKLGWEKDEDISIAVCFFGLSRRLDITFSSICAILEAAKKLGTVTVYLHTYDLKHIKNKRSGEDNPLNHMEWETLNPDVVSITNQENFDRSINIGDYTKHGDPWNDGYASTRNLLRQLNSLHIVTEMSRETTIPHDAFIYLRPDLNYDKFENLPTYLEEVAADPNLIYLPAWPKATIRAGEQNDRFAIAGKNAAWEYGTRFQYAKHYAVNYPLHSETFLAEVLKNLTIKHMCVFGLRIRANGEVFWMDKAHTKNKLCWQGFK